MSIETTDKNHGKTRTRSCAIKISSDYQIHRKMRLNDYQEVLRWNRKIERCSKEKKT